MKMSDMKPYLTCSQCGGPTLQPLPIFYRVTVERIGVDANAVGRMVGLAQFLGSDRLAEVMGPDLEVTRQLLAPVELVVCEGCAYEHNRVIPIALELGQKRDEAEAST